MAEKRSFKRQMDLQRNKRNLLIAKKLGPESQLRQLMEECSELAVAANKVIRTYKKASTIFERKRARDHVVEEMADVAVVMNQIMAFLDISQNELVEAMEEKVDRTWQRINEEKEGVNVDQMPEMRKETD